MYLWRLLETLRVVAPVDPAPHVAGAQRLMHHLELAAWSFPLLLLLIFLRVPIGLSMLPSALPGRGSSMAAQCRCSTR